MSALVLGSIAPDFAYFVPYGSWGGFSHSLPGIFGFCIPIGLFAYFIFHVLIKEPIWRILPWAMRCRLDPKRSRWKTFSLSALLAIAGSIAIGALTHIVWDEFTHRNGEFVHIFCWLNGTVSLGNISLPLYKLLQHLSSILGICILVLTTYRWGKRATILYTHHVGESSRNSVLALSMLVMLGFAGIIVGLLCSRATMVERKLFDGAISGIGTFASASFMYCIFVQLKLRSRPHDV